MRILLTVLIIIGSCLSMSSMTVRLFSNDEVGANKIYSLTQDVGGFLWIGTDYGLRRFDGTRFKTYLHSESDTTSLNDNTILKVLANNTDLWIATEDGLHLYLPGKDAFKLIQLPGKDNHGYISDVTSDTDDGVWFIVGGVGLFHVNNRDNIATGPFLRKYPIGNVIVDKAGECWLSSAEMSKILRFNPKNNSIKSYDKISSPIVCIAENDNQIPIVITASELYVFDKRSDKFVSQPYTDLKESIPIGMAWSQSKKHSFLFSTLSEIKEMASDLTINTFLPFSNSMDFYNISCTALTTDSQSNVWLGRSDGSLAMVYENEEPFKFIDLSCIPAYCFNHKISAITKGMNTDLWIALKDNNILHLDKDGNVIDSLKTLGSPSALCYGNDCIYVWEDGIGLCAYTQNESKKTILYSYAQNRSCTGMVLSEGRELFVAVYGCGLLKYDVSNNKSEWFESESSELINNWITTLRLDNENVLWIGHSGGLSWLNTLNDEIEVVSESSWLRHIKCFSIDVDADNNAWIGTSKGLCTLNRKEPKMTKYSKSDGLSDETIGTVVVCSDGIVWCSTPVGLNRLDSKTNTITNFYGSSGIVDNYFEKNIGLKNEDGLVYFASDKGITFFNPIEVCKNSLTDKIIITDLVINSKSVNTLMKSGNKQIIAGSIYDIEDIYLSFDDNTFSLHLSMDNFYNGDNCQYEYCIMNKEEQWSQLPVGESVLSFHKLSPGDYELHIRARENENISPKKVIRIHISDPWYFSIFAKLIYGILILGALTLIILVLRQKYKKEINEAQIKYFMNISHDIRSPLTLLLSPLETLMRKNNDDSSVYLMRVMHLNAMRIKNLIDQMLDIKKIDDGKLKLHFTKTEIIKYIHDLLEMFHFQAETHKIELTLTSDYSEIYAWIDVNNMDKVLVNLIFNAFKFISDGGSVNIHVTHGISENLDSPLSKHIKILVSDTGKGLDESELSKIFNRFYQSKNASAQTVSFGYGIGLNLCKMIVERHHGRITVENRTTSSGCIFTIMIPQGNDHLSVEEMESNPIIRRQFLIHHIPSNKVSNTDIRKPKRNHGHKILIVDDDEEVVEYLNSQLTYKYRILRANNVRKAFELAIKNKPDLIISDIVMPAVDGIEFLQRIKSNVETNHIPFIIISTLGSVENRINGLKYGADGYIGKPFNMSEISAMIDNLISTRKKLKGKYSGAQEQQGKIKEIIIPNSEKVLMEKIIQVINENFDNQDFSIDILCREVGISRAHLHRKMKEYTGISASDFIRNIRLKKACDLLKNQNTDISQVGYAVGFKNVGYFATIFKRYYGITPTDYKNNAQMIDQ